MSQHKILTICPTRERPHRCKEMLDSFCKNNSGLATLVFGLDHDDPCLDEYKKILKNKALFVISKENNTTKIINSIFHSFYDYKFYHLSNDDFIYETKDFDKLIINKDSGIYYGDDCFHGKNFGVGPFISGDIAKAVGWLQMPELTHLFGDTVWNDIGDKANCLYYIPELKIRHLHFFVDAKYMDNIYKKTNSLDMYESDKRKFIEWSIRDSKEIVRMVKKILKLSVNSAPRDQSF